MSITEDIPEADEPQALSGEGTPKSEEEWTVFKNQGAKSAKNMLMPLSKRAKAYPSCERRAQASYNRS